MEKELDINEIVKLMEENEIVDLEGLRKIIKDYDSLCEDVVQLTCVLALLNSFINEKGLKDEARKYLARMQQGNNNNNKGRHDIRMDEWAKGEVELFCKGQDDYWKLCAKSALKAFLSLSDDNHSGFSWGVTTSLLIRLMDGLPLRPIEDSDFLDQEGMIQQSEEYLREFGLKSDLQCKRMSSLFRQETLDGKVTYHCTDRVLCYDEEDEKRIPFTCGEGARLIDRMFPITMPYWPTGEKYVVMFRGGKPIWVRTPEGEKIDL
jgi:hypothetical protein